MEDIQKWCLILFVWYFRKIFCSLLLFSKKTKQIINYENKIINIRLDCSLTPIAIGIWLIVSTSYFSTSISIWLSFSTFKIVLNKIYWSFKIHYGVITLLIIINIIMYYRYSINLTSAYLCCEVVKSIWYFI